jgi:hypothetical protein
MDTSDYDELRKAIDRLTMNDPSVSVHTIYVLANFTKL